MKNLILTISIVCTILAIAAFTKVDKKSEGAIGDVKYSILSPDKFIEENGAGWKLMDDRVDLSSSSLKTKHGITIIPDARGVFIRGLNLKRNDGGSDTFITEAGHERLVGEFQADGLKKHAHNFSDAYFAEINCGGNQGVLGSHESDGDNGKCEAADVTDQGVGLFDETRPKNIALYVYIKIND